MDYTQLSNNSLLNYMKEFETPIIPTILRHFPNMKEFGYIINVDNNSISRYNI